MPGMKRGMTTEKFLAGSATMASVKMRLPPCKQQEIYRGFFSRRLKQQKRSIIKSPARWSLGL
jgi:hypothetical protein